MVDDSKPVIVVSVPKAGTYLAAEILRAMGLKATHLHIRYDDQYSGVYDFANAPNKMSQVERDERFKPMSLDDSLARVGAGQFAVGHLPPLPEVKQRLCGNFKIVFLVRDLRDCLISHMRYMINTGVIHANNHPWCEIEDERERFKQYLLNYAEPVGPLVHMKLIACWQYDIFDPYPGMELLKLHFEDLVGSDRGVADFAINRLSEFLGLDTLPSTDVLLDDVLARDTQTRSSGLTNRERYWSSFAEKWFLERICDIQGNDLNKMIGYA